VPRADVLVVSVQSTSGWRTAAGELVGSLRRAGASVSVAATGQPPPVRTFMLTDFVEAQAARAACSKGMAQHDPRAVVFCSMTAALLWPRPGAIWLDCTAAENRPGRHGVWQRHVERRRLRDAPLVLSMSQQALGPLRALPQEVLVLPAPVEPSGTPAPRRDIAAITYASGNAKKRRLELVLEAFSRIRRPDEKLVVAGVERQEVPDGVELAGRLAPAEYRGLLRRSRVFVAAPRHEDYGIAPLEALSDGCLLVTTPATGPYPALALARELDPRLVSQDLEGALRIALDDPRRDYAERARELLVPFRRAAVDATVADALLPRLLSQRRA
jgi:hypothetical protein